MVYDDHYVILLQVNSMSNVEINSKEANVSNILKSEGEKENENK